MSDAKAAGAAAAQQATTAEEASLLDQILTVTPYKQAEPRDQFTSTLKDFLADCIKNEVTVSRDTEALINARVAQIDHLISIQLNEILHHEAFKKLEGSWRGLRYLMDHSETSDQLKIKVLNVTKKELLRDLQKAAEFDQSALFQKVYEEEFGTFGGSPIGALIGDYE